MDKGRMGQGNGVRPVVVVAPFCGGLLAAAEAAFVIVVVVAQSPRSSGLLPQELSKERVIELVSPAPCADQQSFIA
jgi:hypothetical protein